jgi:hypothetical protein
LNNYSDFIISKTEVATCSTVVRKTIAVASLKIDLFLISASFLVGNMYQPSWWREALGLHLADDIPDQPDLYWPREISFSINILCSLHDKDVKHYPFHL